MLEGDAEGELKNKKQKQLSGDFPLNHNNQKCKMFPNNNQEEAKEFVSPMRTLGAPLGRAARLAPRWHCTNPPPTSRAEGP